MVFVHFESYAGITRGRGCIDGNYSIPGSVKQSMNSPGWFRRVASRDRAAGASFPILFAVSTIRAMMAGSWMQD